MIRRSEITRVTEETSVEVSVNLDGQGSTDLRFVPVFMRHLLTSMVVHSTFDVRVVAEGDLSHHIIEDIAICLGSAIKESIGQPSEIARFGHSIIPMDCSLSLVAIDICNRPYSVIELSSESVMIEDTQVEDIKHFLRTFASVLMASLHVKVFYGDNEHHKIESVFKALGRSLQQAVTPRTNKRTQASSKGVL